MKSALKFSQLTILILLSFFTLGCGGGGGAEEPEPVPVSDTTPNSFEFDDQVDVSLSSSVESNSLVISGINQPTAVTIEGGEYSINEGEFTSSAGNITNGQSIRIRVISSDQPLTLTPSTLTIGNVAGVFNVTTRRALDAVFVAKVDSLGFSKVTVYQGHAQLDDRELVSADLKNLSSGDLVTIDIEFEAGSLPDYALSAQLIPESLFVQYEPIEQGATLSEIVQQEFSANQGEETVDLGGVYVADLDGSKTHGLIHAKLPTLENTTAYRLIITPSIPFLAANKSVIKDELALIPVFYEEQTLIISELNAVIVKIIDIPKLVDNNDFTQLEIAAEFDENNFTKRAIFESSIPIDITSFAESEQVELSLKWISSKGDILPIGLLSNDIESNPIVSEKAVFDVPRDGGTSIRVPVVAFPSQLAHELMLKFATDVKDVADASVEEAQFLLQINILDENTVAINSGDIELSLPLVSQDLRAIEVEAEDFTAFTVLRAGDTNEACLTVPNTEFDIDTGLFLPESVNKLEAAECSDPDPSSGPMLWRFDLDTKQLISHVTDIEGQNFCIEAIDKSVIGPIGVSAVQVPIPVGNFVDVRVKPCRFAESTLGFPVAPGTAIHQQRFEFDENKIQLLMNNRFLTVTNIGLVNADVELVQDRDIAEDFSRDSEGVNVDTNGRIFYVANNKSFSIGTEDTLKVSLDISAEGAVDYKPVIGVNTQGEVTLAIQILGVGVDLAGASFEHSRYLSKQISAVNGNIHPVEVADGAEATFTIFGLTNTRGELTKKTVDESYDSLTNVVDLLDEETNLDEIEISLGEQSFDRELFDISIVVVGIPINVSGDAEGELKLAGTLDFPGVAIDTSLESVVKLNLGVAAAIALGPIKSGLEAELELLNKTLAFDANAGFEANAGAQKLDFEMQYDVNLKLKILNGTLLAFVEYPRVCLCRDFGETVRKEKSLYQSESLINFDQSFISGQAVAKSIGI